MHSLATPLLASTIEEGFSTPKVIDDLLEVYLSNPILKDIEALVLACTHYPLIKDRIARFYKDSVDIIDSAEIVALSLKLLLKEEGFLNSQKKRGFHHFYVSDVTPAFANNTKLFFKRTVALESHPL